MRRWIAALLLCACGAAGEAADEGLREGREGRFWGALSATAPRPGAVTLTLRLTDAEEQPVEGAAVTAEPWMPAHGHGSPEPTTVTEIGGGEYQVDAVLPMPGHWEIRVEARVGDAVDAFTFPLVVE